MAVLSAALGLDAPDTRAARDAFAAALPDQIGGRDAMAIAAPGGSHHDATAPPEPENGIMTARGSGHAFCSPDPALRL